LLGDRDGQSIELGGMVEFDMAAADYADSDLVSFRPLFGIDQSDLDLSGLTLKSARSSYNQLVTDET
jgi:hypothetical protein